MTVSLSLILVIYGHLSALAGRLETQHVFETFPSSASASLSGFLVPCWGGTRLPRGGGVSRVSRDEQEIGSG